jgi:hypothetical protein
LAGLLALAGLGLGVLTPANNAAVMQGLPRAAAGTGGGLVNTTRGLGTALGIALVTLCLHAGRVGGRVAFAALAAVAVGVALAAAGGPAGRSRPAQR